MYMATYRELQSLNELAEMLQTSHEQPVLFFKHSNACPISSRALGEFQSYLQTAARPEVQHALIVVQKAREVSNKLAELTGIQHESPQVIIVRDGQPVWDESHFKLKSETLAAAAAQA
jgi:bacillithiol system protein YtxJ